ncbi:MAG: PrsW family glutamic-type intramembrane protease [Actinomycetes bacterium]
MPALLTGLTHNTWWRVLLIGAFAWVGSILASIYTGDTILQPATILIGSWLVPFSLLVLIMEYVTRRWLTESGQTALVPHRLLLAFAAGGALGVWPAAAIEYTLSKVIPDGFFLSVAISEEVVKLAIVWMLAGGLAFYTRRDGMLLGAAVGLGFSAVESLGYAYEVSKLDGGVNEAAIIATEIQRGLLTPVGHALWTSLVAGALFAAARNGRLRPSWSLLGWLAVAIGLHVNWDTCQGWAVLLVARWLNQSVSLTEYRLGTLPNLTEVQSVVLGVVRNVMLGVNAAIGLLFARYQWRKGARIPAVSAPEPPTASP